MFLTGAFTTKTGMKGVWHELGQLIPGWGYSLLWALLFASISLLVASLTGKRAFAAGGIVALFLMTASVVGVLNVLPSETAHHLSGLVSPITLISGIEIWLRSRTDLGLDIGDTGPVYGIEAFCLTAACLLLLLARYRKVASL
jgi:ABC-2 type transport system permease protein